VIRVGVITVGAHGPGMRGSRDICAQVIADLLPRIGAGIRRYELVRENRGDISLSIIRMADGGEIDLVLTVGGMEDGLAPEATEDVMDAEVTDLTGMIRARGLDGSTAGLRKDTLIVNLPDDPGIIHRYLGEILPALELTLRGTKKRERDPR